MTPLPESTPEARRLVYGLLITLAAGLTLGRLASAERVNEPSVHKPDGDARPRPAWPKTRPEPWPTFSSNDRSRWAAVRALVDEGTFVVGRRGPAVDAEGKPVPLARRDQGIIFEDGWGSVDKVLHPERQEFYSTKPPLLSVIAAGEYWVLKRAFGWDIVKDRWLVIPAILVTINLLPLILYLALLARLAERVGATDWARYYVVAAAGFATLVTPFLVSFNNHTVATTAVVVAVYAVVCVREGGGPAWFALAGLAAGFAATNELPATALAAGLGVYLLYRFPARTMAFFLPAALVFVVILLGLNYWQLGDWRPTYTKFGTAWYEYEGSHWLPAGQTKPGIDYAGRNGETKATYAFHLLIGHHGWFSLMPIMLLALPGMLLGLASGGRQPLVDEPSHHRGLTPPARPGNPARPIALLTLLVSAVVITFYIARTDNYGGWSNGPRWLMFLTPLWLLCLLPILDVLARSRFGRGFALVLLALSILSMSYQFWNPWRHPWIYNWLESRGWINY